MGRPPAPQRHDAHRGGTTRVLVVSTHRADRGHYAPLVRLLKSDPRFELPNGPPYDVALVLGDRVEMLQAAISCVENRVPLVHIHGGEHTYGSLDERWRWAITAMADWHCPATLEAQEAIDDFLCATKECDGPDIRWHARNIPTGAPGLDGITNRKPLAYPHPAIIHYNPVIDEEQGKREYRAIIEGLGFHTPRRLFSLEQVLHIKMNGDRGSFGVGTELDHETYRDELAAAHVIVGNSSAGIIEAPSLGTWAINVGDRQRGRVRAGNVIDVPAEPQKIREAIIEALSRARYVGPNPYAHPEGRASEAIRDVLLSMAPHV